LVKAIANRPRVSKIYVLADETDILHKKFSEDSKIEILRIWKADRPLSIIGILWQVLKLKPDIIHFNVHFQSYGRTRIANFAGFSLIFLSKILGLKTLVLLHNVGEKIDLRKVRLKPSLTNKIGILVATKLILSASSITVTMDSYMQYLRQRYGHKEVQYIPHGTSAIGHLSINQSGKTILVFGHMGPSKGIPIMFQAFESLTKELKDVKLIVAGNSHPNFPSYLNEMKKIAPPGVDFLGYIQEEDIERIFSIADVVVLPYSTATGTSGVFHLACGYGKPIVATSLPEIRELVNEGASALLVPPENHEALKRAIHKILSDKHLAAKMSEQNLVYARREPWSAVAKAYENAYLKLLHLKSIDSESILSIIAPYCETSNLYKQQS
jgi:glycosyltransferase involved in cell wall biosynthesis